MKRFAVIRLKGLKWSIIDQLTRDMIDLFGLEAYHERSIYKLSGGNKRKTSATLAFMANPSLVFLDEPTTVRRQIDEGVMKACLFFFFRVWMRPPSESCGK